MEFQIAVIVGFVVIVIRQRGGEVQNVAGRSGDQVVVKFRDDGARTDFVDVGIGGKSRNIFAIEAAPHVDPDAVSGMGLTVNDSSGGKGVAQTVDLGSDF